MTIASGSPDVALVTGAAQGLGEAIARSLHGAGMRIVLADLNAEAAMAVARSLDASGKTARGLALDVTDKQSFTNAQQAIADWGSVNVLVNNAAVAFTTAAMEISAEEFDQVIAVNLRGPFFATQIFGAEMQRNGYGRIINIASQAGQMGGTVTGGHYVASKAGLIGVTKYFARAFSGTGVTVNAVSPGPLDLPNVRAGVAPATLAALERSMPAGRLGYPQEVADAVALLASRNMGFVTGATWDINGGTLMR